jgi:curved DNA-binding protein CbpA
MNDLHKAYAVLGLEPGSSMESIMRRYKRLIMVWHPDRAPTPEHKEFAEEELKKINNAKDLLTKHFGNGGGHRTTGCECQPEAAKASAGGSKSSSGASAGPGPNYHRSKTADEKYQEEQAAKKRDADRKAREEQEANAKRAQEEYQQKSAQQSMEAAMQQQKSLQDEKLRWQISIGLIVAFIALEVFGCMAMGAKQWWHDVTWKWQNEHSDSGTKTPDIGTNTGTDTSTSPYIPPYDRTPGGNTTTWQQEQEQRDKEQKEREKKQHDDDVYFTKLEIDKQQKIIEHCNSELTNLEIQIADPNVSEYEKNKLRDMRDFRQKNLSEAQASLKVAQDKLASLTGEVPVQTTPSIVSPFSTNRRGIPFVPIPSNNTSPFAPPADPNSTSLSPSTTGGLNGLSMPSSKPTLSELMKKYADVSPPSGSMSGSSFFGKKDGLGSFNAESSGRLSDLLKKYSTDQNSSTSTNSGN